MGEVAGDTSPEVRAELELRLQETDEHPELLDRSRKPTWNRCSRNSLMPAPKRHPLVRPTCKAPTIGTGTKAPDWAANFAEEFSQPFANWVNVHCIYAVRFSGIRRVNLIAFTYGIFYTVKHDEVRVLAVLHGRRETKNILAGRRQTFKQF